MANKILPRPQQASDAAGRTMGTIRIQMHRVLRGTKRDVDYWGELSVDTMHSGHQRPAWNVKLFWEIVYFLPCCALENKTIWSSNFRRAPQEQKAGRGGKQKGGGCCGWGRLACHTWEGCPWHIQLVAMREAGKAKQRARLLFLFNAVCLCFYFMYAEIHWTACELLEFNRIKDLRVSQLLCLLFSALSGEKVTSGN